MKNEKLNPATENANVNPAPKATRTRKTKAEKQAELLEKSKNVADKIIEETTENVEVVAEKKEAKPRQTAAEKQAELEQAICKQWNISETDLLRYSLKHKKQSQKPIEFFEKLIVNLILGKASFE